MVRKTITYLLLAGLLTGCSQGQGLLDFKVGGLYSISWEEGAYRVVKVLAVGQGCVHIRLYKNKFSERPQTIDPSALRLGPYNDPEGISIGHMPASQKSFIGMRPQFILQTTVREDELDGYEIWKKDAGGSCF